MSHTVPLILGIETSASLCSVCLWSERRSVASLTEDVGFGHASVFFDLLERLEGQLAVQPGVQPEVQSGVRSNYSLIDLTHVAVTRGPGSFTGIRVGLSIANGMALAGEMPLLGLTVFDVVRHRTQPNGPVCVALDTKRQDFYTAFYGLEILKIRASKQHKRFLNP